MLKNYISDYLRGAEFTPQTPILKEILGVKIALQPMSAVNSAKENLEKADVSFSKNGLSYECICVDIHDWDNFIFPIKLGGKDYLCFRKTLYGFTLLNAETLLEERDYFPEAVLKGKESFIFARAAAFGESVIFYGCYWGGPYECYAYDHLQGRFVALSYECGIADADEPEIREGKLFLNGTAKDGASRSVELSETEVQAILGAKGTPELN